MRRKSVKKIGSGWRAPAFCLALIFALGSQIGFAQDDAAAAKTNPTHTHAKAQSHHRRSKRAGSKRRMARGQQKIDPERAEEIQQALIREHYLTGTATGTWNQASEEAMRRYQADHGWQSKTVPDSRALISLGLGPSHDHLLNPESAMTSQPVPTHGMGSATASVQAASVRTASSSSSSSASASASSSTPAPAEKAQPDPAPISQPAHTDPPAPQ
ncbi:MAG: peptidoglycan-binding domain-containing protein [Candidatus Sulfotelmatobacter sp.]